MATTPDDPEYENIKDFYFKIEIPNFLSYMAFGDFKAYVPGVRDLLDGNEKYGIMGAKEKIEKGKIAINALAEFKQAKNDNDHEKAELARVVL
ncbi:hypothetical protein SMA90_31885, partial [Escherichia coli]